MFEKKISEKLVARIWQHQAVTKLFTDTGEPVSIIFPGRICNEGGCDFQDAIFTIGSRLIKGSIEIHIKSSHWYSHGHHQDRKYNYIALHVVMWHDYPSATTLENGKTIPTICLNHFLTYPLNQLHRQIELSGRHLPTCLETKRHTGKESLTKLLNAAGEERFAAKTALFRKSLIGQETGQVLFRSMARALGYDKNTGQFEELADKLTLRTLEGVKDKRNAVKRALIMGTAGLLPSQRLRIKHKLIEEPEINELESIWQSSNITTTMNESDWCFFRVRPDNFPTRRLVALSYLVDRCCQFGLLQSILKLVREAPVEKGYHWIENGLIVSGQGYWTNHFDFGVAKIRSSALIGRSKAAEIAVNILLPFTCAWGTLTAETEVNDKAKKLYLSYPRLEDNQLTRFMKQQFSLSPDCKLTAAQQQGLIHIFKAHCRNRNCHECPIVLSQGLG